MHFAVISFRLELTSTWFSFISFNASVFSSNFPCRTSTSSAGPVNGPSIPFIWIAAILTEKDVLKNCDRCQFSDHSLDQIRLHRQEKHRIWECLKCAESFHNKRSFVLHSCVLHPFSEKYYLSLKGR